MLQELEVGRDDYYRIAGTLAGTFDSGSAVLSMGRSDAGTLVEGSRHEIQFLNGKFEYGLSSRLTSMGSFRYSDSERRSFPEDSGGPEFSVGRELDRGESENFSAQLALRIQLAEQLSSSLTGSWFRTESEENSPGIYPGFEVPPNGSETDFDRYQLSWNNQLRWRQFRLSVGIDARREEGDSVGYLDYGVIIPTDFSLRRDTLAPV